MSELIARAKKVLEGVTEGPWEAQEWTSHANGERGCGILAGVGMKQRGIAWTGQYHWNPEAEARADAEFIAAARTLIPELIDALETTPTHDPHTGSTIYDGDPTVLWLAICHDGCGAHEFDCPEERDSWISGHRDVHDVSKALEVRE